MSEKLNHMEQDQNRKTHSEKPAEEECQDYTPSYEWSRIFNCAWHKFSPAYLPNIWVTLAFALIGPGIGLAMKNPKIIVYGSGFGVCVLVMVFTYFIAQQLSEDSKAIKNAQTIDIKAHDGIPQPSVSPSPLLAKKTSIVTPSKSTKSTINSSHSTKTAYSQLTNEQLKDAVYNLVPKMRMYVQQKHSLDMNRSEYFSQLMRQTKSEEERHRIWEMQSREYTTAIPLNSEYGALFKAEAILLHEELLKRLPNEPKGNRSHSDYEFPTNPIGLNMVIDDLDRLAKSLPK